MALEIRPRCENCGSDLEPGSPEACICSFECTFCLQCAADRLGHICPRCGGELVRRPIRPEAMLKRFPASTVRVVRPAVAVTE